MSSESKSYKNLLIVQPGLRHYRMPVYKALSRMFSLRITCSEADNDHWFSEENVRKLRTIRYRSFSFQRSLISEYFKFKPDIVWIAADVNMLSSLLLSVVCFFKGTPVILHGQGLVKCSRFPVTRKLLLKNWLKISKLYVAYAEPCLNSLIADEFPHQKMCVINNRFEQSASLNETSRNNKGQTGILYIGRLRPGCEIKSLVHALASINRMRDEKIPLHIIGDGEYGSDVRKAALQFSWIHCYGKITSESEISAVTKECSIGVYPGKAGLSVLSYMGHNLGVIVGNDLSMHMGPEPSYVVDGVNGWTFNPSDPKGLEKTLRFALATDNLNQVRKNAIETFNDLHRVSYAGEMAEIIEQVLNLS